MESATILSGFGGQGLLFAGQVLAQAGLEARREVTWLPSYGPEMRGGAASCTVVVSDHAIGSPVVDAADVVIALNPPALARFEAVLRPGGLLVVNASLVEADPRRDDVEAVRVPCSAIAREAGDDRLVSIVALGAALARRPILSRRAARRALRLVAAKAGSEAVKRNLAAFDAGYAHAAPMAG
jgi:2-oxoglutarate ferredoxin oxidoreductase subunit gamma